MKSLQKLMQEIIEVTTRIETDYPELYKYLNETPIEVDPNPSNSIGTSELKKHLETLKEILNHFIVTHPK